MKKIFPAFILAALFFVSCELFSNSIPLTEEDPSTDNTELSSNKTKECRFVITPQFGSQDSSRSSRAAYPGFSSLSSSSYKFTAASPVLGDGVEVEGSLVSGTSDIEFSFSTGTFTNKTFTIYIKDSSDNIICSGQTSLTYSTIGEDLTATVYFQQYTSSTAKGYVDLTVTTTSHFTFLCSITKDGSLASSSITTTITANSCHLESVAGGITPGTYTATFAVYKDADDDGSPDNEEMPYEYLAQQIYVWPGLTTNSWYLPDGTTDSTYSLPVNKDEVKLYIQGENPTGPYADGSGLTNVSEKSDSNSGRITAPLESMAGALAKCTSTSTDYRIIVCGTLNENTTISSSVQAHSITIEGCTGADGDVLYGSGSTNSTVLTVENSAKVIIKNIKITNGNANSTKGAGITVSTGADVEIQDGTLLSGNTGNAVFCNSGIFTMSGGEISGNTNGILFMVSNTCFINGGSISNNTNRSVFTATFNQSFSIGGNAYLPLSSSDRNYIQLSSGCYVNITSALNKHSASLPLYVFYASDSSCSQGKTVLSGETDVINSEYTKVICRNPGFKINSLGKMELKHIITDLYVKADGTDPTGNSNVDSTWNNSTISYNDDVTNAQTYPFATIKKALQFITWQNSNEEYTIHVSGELTGAQKIQNDTSDADNPVSLVKGTNISKLTLTGSDKTTDILNGNFGSSPVTDGTTLTVYTTVPCDIKNLTITGGNTLEYGGGLSIDVSDAAEFTVYNIENCIITGNNADKGGGIYYLSDGDKHQKSLNLIDCTLSSNTAVQQGGAIDCMISDYLTFKNTSVSGNKATAADSKGGALCDDAGGSISLYPGTVFSENEAASGGAMWCGAGLVAQIDDQSESNPCFYIPYGVDGVKAPGKNDVYLRKLNGHIYLMGDLIPPAESDGIIATLTPEEYTSSVYVLNAASDNTIAANAGKFAIMPETTGGGGTQNWGISDTGYLKSIIGTKIKPTAVADIVFTDGSAMSYSDFNSLSTDVQDAKKSSAIAVIFYAGTGLNSGTGDTTYRILGTGLKQTSALPWCRKTSDDDAANAYSFFISTIQCNYYSGSAGYYDLFGDRNGSDNLEQIGAFLEENGSTDDTGTDENYPAFYFGKNYKSVEGSHVAGTDYEYGWYLPSIAELQMIYVNGKGTDKLFDINAVMTSIGGDTFKDETYKSSSDNSTPVYHYSLYLGTGNMNSSDKGTASTAYICAIREF